MSGFKHVLVFGSFTEDEIRAWQQKQSSQGNPVEKTELQFGSLDFVVGKPLAVSNGDSSRQLVSENGLLGSQPMNSIKDGKVKIVNAAKGHSLKASPKQNGNIANSTNSSALTNGAKESKKESIDLTSLYISQKEVGLPSPSSSLNFHVLEENHNHNGTCDDSPVYMSIGDSH